MLFMGDNIFLTWVSRQTWWRIQGEKQVPRLVATATCGDLCSG